MLSRKAICLWLLAVSVCLGLAVSAAVLGQQPAPGPSVAEKGEEQPQADAGVSAFAGGAAAPDTAGTVGASSRSRRATAGGGRSVGVAAAGGGSDTAGPTKAPPSSSRSRYSSGATYDGYSGRPANVYGPTGFPGEDSPYFVYNYGTKRRRPDPEMEKLLEQDAKMEQQARVFAKQFREAEGQQQRAEARGELEALTKDHFDLRQKRRELELSRLEEQLERVRASIKKRSEVKDLIIQRRIARLLGEEDALAF